MYFRQILINIKIVAGWGLLFSFLFVRADFPNLIYVRLSLVGIWILMFILTNNPFSENENVEDEFDSK
jgi:hypothetical protein